MVRILPMTLEHLSAVMEIERESFTDSWSKASFVREITENPYAVYFTATCQGEIIGYIGGWLITDELHITNLATAVKFRRKGIAEQLINKILQYSSEKGINRATLEVRASNNSAISLYRKMGFSSVGYRPNYYTNNNEDAMIMWKGIMNEDSKDG